MVSGRGSNLEALLKEIAAKKINGEPVLIISNVPGAFALKRVRKFKVKSVVIDSSSLPKDEYERKLLATLEEYNLDLICLAGYMKIVPPAIIKSFQNKIINIHPALLPAFPGLHVQKKALEYGVKFSGCTVHFIDEGVDSGPIILQAVVPVKPDDTEDTLSARILKEEHRIYPEAVKLFCQDRLKIVGRVVKIR
jgi:phosphoribosylglycinamide formyltransferase-1